MVAKVEWRPSDILHAVAVGLRHAEFSGEQPGCFGRRRAGRQSFPRRADFGCKGSAWMYMLVTAAIARELKRPVKYVMERENMFTSNGYRPMTEQLLQLGADKDGKLTFMRHHSKSSNSTVGEFMSKVPDTRPPIRSTPARTGSSTIRSTRSTSMRRRSCARRENHRESMRSNPPWTNWRSSYSSTRWRCGSRISTLENPFSGKPYSSCNLEECYRVAGDKFGWSKRNPKPASTVDGDWLIGWGMATATYPAQRSQAKAHVSGFWRTAARRCSARRRTSARVPIRYPGLRWSHRNWLCRSKK